MRKNLIITTVIALLISMTMEAQQDKEPNVFLITLDGVRWQDVFTGIDTNLLNSDYTENKELLTKKFIDGSLEENRELLMPFFWNTIAKELKEAK